MAVPLPSKKTIDMTLRMWSDHLPLKPFLDQMDVSVHYLYAAGEPIANKGRFAGRTADRHYASLANVRGNENSDVLVWLAQINQVIELHKELVCQLLAGHIEALLWIAIFGAEFAPVPSIDPQIVDSCSRLGLRIMVENYTDFDQEGVPKKIWLNPT